MGKVSNVTNNTVVADNARLANTFLSRLKGLMFRKYLEIGEGLIIEPCNSIHTFNMKFSLDIIFLSKENEVVHLIESIPPGRISSRVAKAAKVLEVASGTIKATDTKLGDRLIIE